MILHFRGLKFEGIEGLDMYMYHSLSNDSTKFEMCHSIKVIAKIKKSRGSIFFQKGMGVVEETKKRGWGG